MGITKPNYTRFGVELADTVSGGSGITGWKIEANPAVDLPHLLEMEPIHSILIFLKLKRRTQTQT